jgi:hypothetical protein
MLGGHKDYLTLIFGRDRKKEKFMRVEKLNFVLKSVTLMVARNYSFGVRATKFHD